LPATSAGIRTLPPGPGPNGQDHDDGQGDPPALPALGGLVGQTLPGGRQRDGDVPGASGTGGCPAPGAAWWRLLRATAVEHRRVVLARVLDGGVVAEAGRAGAATGREDRGRVLGTQHGRPVLPGRALLDARHVVEHLAGVTGTVAGIAGGRPGDQVVEFGGDPGHRGARRGDRVVRVLVGDLHRLFALVGLLAGEHLVEHDAERVDVAAGVGRTAGDELGGEVRDGAEERGTRGGVGGRGTREPEVPELDPTVVGEQDVLGLEVAVHDAGAVRGRQAGEHGTEDVRRLFRGERAVLVQEVPQRDARDVLHHDVDAVVLGALVVHAHQVRVRQAGGGTGLLDEAFPEGLVVGQVPVHDLDRDAALESDVGGEVHGRHPAPRDAGADAVPLIDHATDHRVRGGVRGHLRHSTKRGVGRPHRRTGRYTISTGRMRRPRSSRPLSHGQSARSHAAADCSHCAYAFG
jgi:hypothetical protein